MNTTELLGLIEWDNYLYVAALWFAVLAVCAALEKDLQSDERLSDTLKDQTATFARAALAAPVWPAAILWWLVIKPLGRVIYWLWCASGYISKGSI